MTEVESGKAAGGTGKGRLDYGVIDMVVTMYTPTEFAGGNISTDDGFREKTKLKPEYRGGVTIEQYLEKMDRAGIERRAGREVSIGAVYTTLSRLEEKGHVRSRLGEPTEERGGRAKRFFRLTPGGLRSLKQSLSSLDRMVGDLVGEWSLS